MEKIFITVVILYALFVGIYLLRLKVGKRRRKNIVGQGSSIQETGRLKSDIVGKSRFDLSAAKPLAAKSEPLAASSPKTENSQENPNIFAQPNEVKPWAEVPQEELDEAFEEQQTNKAHDLGEPTPETAAQTPAEITVETPIEQP